MRRSDQWLVLDGEVEVSNVGGNVREGGSRDGRQGAVVIWLMADANGRSGDDNTYVVII